MSISEAGFTRRRMLAMGGGAVGAMALNWSAARAAKGDSPSADAEGWITLFDGKTLNGWHKNPKKIGHGTGGNWTVEPGGVLAGEQDPPGSGNGGVLLTDRKFHHFELSIDVKPAWGSDSGIFLWGNDLGQCIQMTVDYYDGGNIGHFYGEETGGWVARSFSIQGEMKDGELASLKEVGKKSLEESGLAETCTADEWLAAWKIGDWNTVRIRMEGDKYALVTSWINGLKVGVFDAAKTTADKYNRDDVRKLLGDSGSIAVQVHGTPERFPAGKRCRWRNIRVREL